MRRLHTDDRGMAIATVALLGLAVVMVTSIMTLRGTRQVRNTSSDAQWEQALHVAEAGLDYALVVVKINSDYTTGEIVPSFDDPDAERAWAVTAADAQLEADLGETPEGDYAIVMPLNDQVIYSVGFAPSRDAIDRRVRVVRVSYARVPGSTQWRADRAFVTNRDLTITGNPVAFEARANVHANGHITVSGNPTVHDACLSSSDGATVIGNLNDHPACPWPGDQETSHIPVIDPRDFWSLSEYDLCPAGVVRAGPAHGSFGASAASEPCTGSVLEADAATSPYLGWEYQGSDPVDGERWVYDTNVENHGSFYIFQGSAWLPTGPGTNTNPWYVSLFVEAAGGCPANVGGDIVLSGAAVLAPATGAGSMFMVAGRDIHWNGNGRLKAPGVIAAAEQVSIVGNPQVEGSFIASEACDTEGDGMDASAITGNPVFELDGPIGTTWEDVGSEGSVAVVAWDEL
jgi:hypothetical protein